MIPKSKVQKDILIVNGDSHWYKTIFYRKIQYIYFLYYSREKHFVITKITILEV